MRYPAAEKLEIIRTVEGSHLPTKMTLDMLGIPRTTFYRWYDRYVEGGLDAFRADIADAILDRIIHNAHRVELKGDSMRRKSQAQGLTQAQNSETITTDE
jgi:transposase-like protein